MTKPPPLPEPKTSWCKTPGKAASKFKTARAKHRSRYSLDYHRRAKRIKRLRTLLKQSQVEFAEQFGVLSREINRWESGYHAPEMNNWVRFLDLERMAQKVVQRAREENRKPNFKVMDSGITSRRQELERFGRKQKRVWGNPKLKG